MLVLVCGLPGTGKSTVARVLRERVAAEWVRTDEVRKALFEKPEYTKEEREFVYDQILKLAEIYLRQNKSVIIDATFHRRATRQKFIDLSKKLGVKLAIVECVCSEEASRRFIKERGEKEDPSDADYEVYLKVKKDWEPIEEKHVVINTEKDFESELDKHF